MPFTLTRETEEAKDAYIEFVHKAAVGAAIITKLRKDFEAKFPHVTSDDVENWTEDCFKAFKLKQEELEAAAEKVLSGKGISKSRTSPAVPLIAKIEEGLSTMISYCNNALETKYEGKLVGADVKKNTEARLQKNYPGAKLQGNYNAVPIALTATDQKAGKKTSSIQWVCLGDNVETVNGKTSVDKEVDIKACLSGITAVISKQSTAIKAEYEKRAKNLHDELSKLINK